MTNGFIALPTTAEDIEEIARFLRDALEVREGYLPIMDLLEFKLPILLGDSYNFEVWSAEEMQGDEGRAWPSDNLIVLREDVYCRALAGKSRDRFTAVHELAHLVLHRSPFLSRRAAGNSCKAERDPEWQADRLAAALLMPACQLRKTATLHEAIERFGVSPQDAQKRARSLDLKWRSRPK